MHTITQNKKFDAFLDFSKCVYLCIFTVYLITREILALNFFINHIAVVAFFFGVAIIYIGLDMLKHRDCFKTKYFGLCAIFLAITGISCVVNMEYGIFSNAKGVAAFVTYLFLLYPEVLKDKTKTTLNACLNTAFFTISCYGILGIPMYFYDVTYTIGYKDSGFSTVYYRLWGLFQEANFGAMYILLAILISVLLFKQTKSIFKRIVLIVLDVFNIVFISLSGSRMTTVCMAIALFWILLIVVFQKLRTKLLYRIGALCLAMLLSVLVPFGTVKVINFCMPVIKKGIIQMSNAQVYNAVHTFYDTLYVSGNLIEPDSLPHSNTGNNNQGETNSENSDPSQDNFTNFQNNAAVDKVDRTDKKDDISNGRFARWKDGLTLFSKSPIIGVSPRNVFTFAEQHFPESLMNKYQYSISNIYIELLVGTGICGFLSFMMFFVLTVVAVIRKSLFKNPNLETVIFSSILVVIAVSGFFIGDLFLFQTCYAGFLFWFCLGYCLHKKKEN